MILLIVLCCSTLGCIEIEPENSKTEKISIESFVGNNNGISQLFHIILIDQILEDFYQTAQNVPSEQLKNVYEKLVIKPIESYCFKDGEYLHLIKNKKIPPDMNIIEKYLDNKEKLFELRDTIKEALIKSASYLKGPPTTNVCVLPISEYYDAALTIGSGKILVYFNPYLTLTKNELAGIVAHEYHHSVWTANYYDPYDYFTLLDFLIFEGKAIYFQEMVFPNSVTLPDYTDDRYTELRKKLYDTLDSINTDYQNKVMFGDSTFPIEFGYHEGYCIVKQFLDNNPELSVDQWTALKPSEFLDKQPNW